jgi:hypothetical protein
VREWTLHTPKWAPTLGVEVSMDFWIFRKQLQESKFIKLKSLLYHWKSIETKMFKMGSHDPFRHIKHKLWPKEGSKVKLPIWLLTNKSWESPRFTYVQVACNIPLENSEQGLQLFIRPYLNRRFAQKVMGLQSCKSLNFKNLGVPRQNDIWVQASWLGTKNIIRGKVVASRKSWPWWVLWVCVGSWFVCVTNVLRLCINQLVV